MTLFSDCADIMKHHTRGKASGLFEVNVGQGQETRVVEVYCDQSGFMGGWLLVQQRETGLQSFNRSWAEYRQGFGSVDAQGRGEVWLGNHNLHLLTSRSESMLRVELEDWEGGVATAQYGVRVSLLVYSTGGVGGGLVCSRGLRVCLSRRLFFLGQL